MTREAMLAKAPVPSENIHPIRPTALLRTRRGATSGHYRKSYGAATLDPRRPLFDVTLLGLGSDGHTASLLPGEPVLDERKRWVVAVSHGRPEVRITMTYPVIGAAAASRSSWLAKKRQRRIQCDTHGRQSGAGGARSTGWRAVLVCRSSGGRQ